MKLWPHQVNAVQVCGELHKRSQSRVLQQAPPGTGKTEIAARVALAYLKARPFGRALVSVPTAPILQQFKERLAWMTSLPVAVDKAEQRAHTGSRLVIGSINSLWDRLEGYGPDTLLLFDEVHHANLDAPENLRVAQAFKHVVGLSASPWTRGCTALFEEGEHLVLGLSEAQRQGLSPPYEVLDWIEPRGPFGLVFCSTNEECEARAALHTGSSWVGINSGEVPERINAWRSGQIGVLYANRMLGEGFDEPRCDRVWLAVESESEIRYVQTAGRALRQRPGKVARLHCATKTIKRRLTAALRRCDDWCALKAVS